MGAGGRQSECHKLESRDKLAYKANPKESLIRPKRLNRPIINLKINRTHNKESPLALKTFLILPTKQNLPTRLKHPSNPPLTPHKHNLTPTYILNPKKQ